jgi:hypothetical protein
LPLQSNGGHHPTPLFWYLGFHGNDILNNGCRCHGNGQNAKKNEKHKNDHSKLLAKQKLMKLDKNNIHINKPKKSESVTIVLIFILVAILKILKTKSTTLSNDLFLCQVSKGSAVWSEFNIFCTLVTMATAAILNFFNPLAGYSPNRNY